MAPDRFAPARAVADALLYEGYVLYPYRASALKNQARWQFGVLVPRSYADADPSERWAVRTECLVDPGGDPRLSLRIRFLQLQRRTVEELRSGHDPSRRDEYRPVDLLEAGDRSYPTWDEAVERSVDLPPLRLAELGEGPRVESFAFTGGTETEAITGADGSPTGRLKRRRHEVAGRVRVEASRPAGVGELVKVAVVVENSTVGSAEETARDQALGHSLLALHMMLAVDDGRFISSLEPPEHARSAVGGCDNDGVFPVLVGEDDLVLASPIILYDHPAVAPESPGDLYDATEIDEILALRVLTMTDEEKAEARGTDPRAAAIVDRCDDMSPELWERLHGAIRSIDPPSARVEEHAGPIPWWDPVADGAVDPWNDSITLAGVEVAKGALVRLRPSRRADAQDIFLSGMRATVAGVFSDVDGNQQVAVTLDDDPATAELLWQGRFLFFYPEEIEPLDEGGETR